MIAKLIAAEGETLPVGAPLAVIEARRRPARHAARRAAPAGVRTQPKAAPALPPAPGKPAAAGAPPAARPQQPPTLRAVRSEPRPQAAAAHAASQAPAAGSAAAAAPPQGAQAPGGAGGAGAHRRYSPVVMRMAEEHGIDLTRVPGTGIGGRVSKRDVLAYLDALQAGQVQPPAAPSARRCKRAGGGAGRVQGRGGSAIDAGGGAPERGAGRRASRAAGRIARRSGISAAGL